MIGKLNGKQRKFLKHYLEHHNASAAAKYAGSKGKDGESLKVIGHHILTSLNLLMPEVLDARGLGLDFLAERCFDGATKAETHVVATYKGTIGEEKSYPDHSTRAKYVEMLGRMHGVFVDRHELTGKEGGDIILQFKRPGEGKKRKTITLDGD